MLAVHIEKRRVGLRRCPRPRRKPGHALIRLLCGGLCNTDLELLRGYYNFRGTPGHEFVGEVREADDGAWLGKRGPGKLGRLIARVLAAHGCSVRLYGRHDPTPRAAFRWVVDATGSAEGLRQCIEMTEPRGTVIVKSTVHGAVRLDTAAVVVNEITLVGSRCGRLEPALDILRDGKVRVGDLITARYALGVWISAHRIPQDGLQPLRRHTSRVREVDLMVRAFQR